MMALDEAAISSAYTAVVSHVDATGEFEIVNGHEPKSLPRTGGVTAAVWAEYLGPATGSGLAATSALLVLNVRVQRAAIVQSRYDADAMDPRLLAAMSAVIGRLAGDLTLGGVARTIDVRGMSGRRLEARAGYFEQDRSLQRVLVATVPIIINDAWVEAP